jgi:hypothetical protein
MAVATFDTLKFANTLKAAGVPEKQAEAQASAFAEVMQLNLKELVTKDDLKQEGREAEQRLNSRIDAVAADVKALRAELKGEMLLLKWMFGAVMGVGVAILVRLFLFRAAV